MSAAAPYAYDFNWAGDLLDWMARQCRSHLRIENMTSLQLMISKL